MNKQWKLFGSMSARVRACVRISSTSSDDFFVLREAKKPTIKGYVFISKSPEDSTHERKPLCFCKP
jgi:hypothetical protein